MAEGILGAREAGLPLQGESSPVAVKPSVGDRASGFSLLEASIALALLASAVLVVVALFHSSLRYGSRIEQEQVATLAARSVLAQVREWARQRRPGGRNFDVPAEFPAHPALPDFPGFEASVRLLAEARDTPASSWERAWPAAPRRLGSSFLRAEVTIRMPDGRSLTLGSLVGDPPRALRASQPVVISAVPGSLAPNQELRLTVQVFDEDGQPLRDPLLHWSVRPVDGVATLLSQSRDGSEATFKNQARRADGSFTHTGGTCRFAASLVYRGQTYTGLSEPVALLRP